MEIVEVIRKNGIYVHKSEDVAYNPEKDIALFEIDNSYEFAFKVGCNKIFDVTTNYKLLFPEKNYNDAWDYIDSVRGNITSYDKDFDLVMNDEGLQGAFGNVRIQRINFNTKIQTNGRNCEPCQC